MKKSLSLIFAALLCVFATAQETPNYVGTWYFKHAQSGLFLTQKKIATWNTEVGLAKNGSQFTVSAIDDSGLYNICIVGRTNNMGTNANGQVFVDQTLSTGYTVTPTEGGVVVGNGSKYFKLVNHSDGYMYLALKEVAVENADVFELSENSTSTYTDIRIIDDFDSKNEKQVYTITTKRGAFVYTDNGLSSTTKLGINVDATDENQQFMFLKNPETGKRYLYSVGKQSFLKQTGNKKSVVATLWDPSQDVEVLLSTNNSAKTDYPAILRLGFEQGGPQGAKYMIGVSNGFTPAVIGYNDQSDEGNAVSICPVNGVTYEMTFEQATADPRIPLRAIYETAKAYSVGDDLNQYSVIFNTFGQEVSYNEFWNATIEEVERIMDGSQEPTEERIQVLITTLESYIPQLRHNTVHENSFVRLQSKANEGKYVQNVNASNNRLDVSTDNGKNSIFLIRGGSLVSYSSGLFVNNNSSKFGVATTPDTKTDVEIVATTSDKTVYAVRFKGTSRYLHSSATATDAGTFNDNIPTNNGYHFILEQVTELPITMNNVDGGYYGTINFPVAVLLPEGLSAYSAIEKPTHLTLTKVAEGGQVLKANTPVVIYSESNVESLTISSEVGNGATGNCLSGTVEEKTVESGVNYVLGNKDGLAFYLYTDTEMPAFKAYLAPSSATSQKFGLIFADDDDLTGVANAIKEAARTNTTVFDINGRKVNELVKGQLYIQGGKKFRY